MQVKLTKEKLLRLLGQNRWEKQAVADILGTGEASVRRACRKFHIDTDQERRKAAGTIKPEVFKIAKTTDKAQVNKGTFVAIPDIHGVSYDRPAVAAICAFIKDFKPEYVFQMGDAIDNTCLMGKVKQQYPNFNEDEIKEMDLDYFCANEFFDSIDGVCTVNTKKIYLVGNHEFRSDLILAHHPCFDKLLNYKERLRLKDRGWDCSRKYLEPASIGKLHLFHGEYFCENHLKKHVQIYRRNLLYAHLHQIGQISVPSPMQEIPTWVATCGTVSNVNPEWQRSKSNNWELGFAYGFYEPNGDFDVVLKRIIHGKFHAEGRTYCGPRKA
jgi:hypothetical protein